MEIKALRNYQLPKFALTVAAAAVLAGTMTACRTEGEVATSGVAPAPTETEEVQLMGEVEAVELDGIAPAPAETEDLRLMGKEREVELAGDVAVEQANTVECGNMQMQDFWAEFDRANLEGTIYADVFAEAFEKYGIRLIPAVNTEDTYLVWTSEDKRTVAICFFDSDIERNGCSMYNVIAQEAMKEFDWGFIVEQDITTEDGDPARIRYLYVNLRWCEEDLSPETAARIAESALNAT